MRWLRHFKYLKLYLKSVNLKSIFSWNSIAQKTNEMLDKFLLRLFPIISISQKIKKNIRQILPYETGTEFFEYLDRFLGNGVSRKNAFEFYWPLSTTNIKVI